MIAKTFVSVRREFGGMRDNWDFKAGHGKRDRGKLHFEGTVLDRTAVCGMVNDWHILKKKKKKKETSK